MTIYVVHCKKVPESEYIGRPSPLGNPYPLKKGMERGSTLSKYREWLTQKILDENETVLAELNRLTDIAEQGDLYLGCWCAPNPCHGDVIKEFIERALNR